MASAYTFQLITLAPGVVGRQHPVSRQDTVGNSRGCATLTHVVSG